MRLGRLLPLLMCCVLAPALPAFAATEASCMEMVKGVKLGATFGEMLFQSGTSTQTYVMLANKVGSEKAEAMFRQEMVPVVARYQEEWNRNLARAWAKQLTDAECQSLGKLGGKSPHRQRFESTSQAAGEAMNTTSAPLLRRAASEVLYAAFARTMVAPPAR
jgi:hypothetical protein